MTSTPKPGPSPDELHAELDTLLSGVVARITQGAASTPRPGQTALAHDILDAMLEQGGQCLAVGRTGLGKSFAYLAPAMLVAARLGERTVISTESLALQSQLVDKDAPDVAHVVAEQTGVHLGTALLKGWSNFTCLRSTLAQASELIGKEIKPTTSTLVLRELADRVEGAGGSLLAPDVEVDGRPVPAGEVRSLVAWSLRQHADDALGDRAAYPGRMSEPATWDLVSVTPAECVGVATCPLADLCRPAAAKTAAAEADIVVTNHSMLAVQAANDISVVIGSAKLGRFDHVVVDEAHDLPAKVRSQGARTVHGGRVLSVVRALTRVLDTRDKTTQSLLNRGGDVAEAIQSCLAPLCDAKGPVRLGDGDDPLEDVADLVEVYLDQVADLLTRATRRATGAAEIAARRARTRIDNLKSDLKAVARHQVGQARWLEVEARGTGRAWARVSSSPVDVSGLLRTRLWTTPVVDEETSEPDEDLSVDRAIDSFGRPIRELSVVAVSATLPKGFAGEIGARVQVGAYESPFASAYAGSMLFVPRASSHEDLVALGGSRGKGRFDVQAHRAWAARIIRRLVEANGGSALVLAATAESGKAYREALSVAAMGRWQVLSQWDGQSLRQAVTQWRETETAVLVGTRSLMTGVDAPGRTCSLVVIDRIPRAAGNPVDDARAEAIAQRLQSDKWSADRMVYGADAALLLEQASGRLIRSVTDRGMVAVLDPRLLRAKPLAYPEPTRNLYLGALEQFTRRTADVDEATVFLAALAAGEADAA